MGLTAHPKTSSVWVWLLVLTTPIDVWGMVAAFIAGAADAIALMFPYVCEESALSTTSH